MLSRDELIDMLEECLKQNGIKYDYSADKDIFFTDTVVSPYIRYISLTLKSVTGLLNGDILREYHTENTDMDLINKITSCLLKSKNDELVSIAWNSFIALINDERFLLSEEMQKEKESYYQQYYSASYKTNHTPVIESDRLLIKPKDEEAYNRIFQNYYAYLR